MSSKRQGSRDEYPETLPYYYFYPDLGKVTKREQELQQHFNRDFERFSPYSADLAFYRCRNGVEYGLIQVENGSGKTEYSEVLGRVEEEDGERYFVEADHPAIQEFFPGSVGVNLEPERFNDR